MTPAEFWANARTALPHLPKDLPEAWGFGATAEHADELLDLVLQGIKTGTASSQRDYDATNEPLPQVGELSIILDGSQRPRAIIETTEITIVPFNEVTAEHAHAEGEGDRTLDYWRESHERFWRDYSYNERGFEVDMPVICERFRIIYPVPALSE